MPLGHGRPRTGPAGPGGPPLSASGLRAWKRWAKAMSSARCSGVSTSPRSAIELTASLRGLVGEGDLLAAEPLERLAVDLGLRELAGHRLPELPVLLDHRPELVDQPVGDAPRLLLLLLRRVHPAQHPLDRHPGVLLRRGRVLHHLGPERGARGPRSRGRPGRGPRPGRHRHERPDPPPTRPPVQRVFRPRSAPGSFRASSLLLFPRVLPAPSPGEWGRPFPPFVGGMKKCEAGAGEDEEGEVRLSSGLF